MASSPVLLLLLALGLCCSEIHNQRIHLVVKFRGSEMMHPQEGQKLELECQTPREDSGAYWLLQDKQGTLCFIVFISSMDRVTFEGNQGSHPRFSAKKQGKSYQLVVNSFKPEDEGKYFCLVNLNQKLYFSPSLPAFLPVVTAAAPTTAGPTTLHNVTEQDFCLKTTDPETSKKRLDFFCDIFIWIPLAGACLLLLIALVITISLCQKTRRRRCRCKRPVNGKAQVKPSRPSPHM